jgi:LysM repeat protein
MVALSGSVKNPRTGRVVPYRVIQPVLDMVTQYKQYFPRGVNLGTIGNRDHLLGKGDHTPWAGDVVNGKRHQAGLLYADDLGKSKDALDFDPGEFLFEFLLPRLQAKFYPELKYLLTEYKLVDRRYWWRLQKGGDGPGHVHCSFMPGHEKTRSYVIRDYYAWLKNGKPKVGTRTPTKPVTRKYHTVMVTKGDTLSKIGDRAGVPWQTLAKLNGIKGPKYVITPGQLLKTRPVPVAAKPPARATIIVRKGDTLAEIGKRVGVSWRTLALLNKITGPRYVIRPGQILKTR